MDDAAKAPQSQFSRSSADVRARLENALAELSLGGDPLAALEAAEEEAEREGGEAALATACADLLGSDVIDALPHAARLEVLLKIAWLCGQREEQAAAALVAASHALGLAPADERALAIAEPLWLEAEEYGELANRYAIAATSANDEARARHLLEHAIHMLDGIVAATPAVLGLSERLEKLPALRESEEALLALVRAGGAEGSLALVKLGERWLAEGRTREGVQKLPDSLDDFAGDAALDVLERLLDQAEEVERLAKLLQRRASLEQSAVGRGRAQEKLASFEQDLRRDTAAATSAFLAAAEAYAEAGEADDAERAYERLLNISPDHTQAAAKLVSLRAKANDFAGVADAFSVVLRSSNDNRVACELLLSLANDAERASAAQEFAELADDVSWRLSGDERELAEQLLRTSATLFATQTRYDEAAELYRRLIADRATSEDLDAYQALIDAHPGSEWRRNQQRWLFEWQENHSSDRPTVLLSWARFEEHELGDPQAAMNVLGRAAELAPDRAEIWENLARLRLADGDGSGGLLAAGELRRLGRDVDASLLGLLLEHEPTARFAIDRVKLTLSAEQRWPELFALYERAIAATVDPRDRATWLDEAAIAARDVAQDRPRAVRYWERYTELSPTNARVDLALERLYEQADDKPALIRHLKRRLTRLEGAEKALLERRVTNLSLIVGALGDALATIERLGADSIEANELLEQLFARSLELAPNDAEARQAGQKAAKLLRARYTELELPQQSARLLRAELSLSLPAEERRALLSELSRLCERELDDLPAALDAERELFLSTLAEKERKRLEKLSKKLGRWAELCDTYAEAATTMAADTELETRRALFRRAADVATAQLRDPSRATSLYRRFFELEPELALTLFEQLERDHGQLPEAFEALCQFLTQARRFEDLSRVLLGATETRPSPTLFSRLGRLQADELGDEKSAIASHLAANDVRAAAEVFLRKPSVFGDDSAPSLELAEQLVGVGLPEGALRVLRHQLAHYEQQSPPARKLVHLALVKTLVETGQSDAATEELTEAAKRYPTDPEVQRACAVAAAARQDWDKAEQCYRTLLLLLHGTEKSEATLRRAEVYVALAAIKLRRGDEPAASELIESGFEAALGDARELTALAQSLAQHERWDAAERATLELLKLARDLPSSARALLGVIDLERRTPSPALLEQAKKIAQNAAQRFRELSEPGERSNLLSACVSLLPLAEAQALLAAEEAELLPADAVQARLTLARRLLDEQRDDARQQAIGILQALVSHLDAPPAAWQLLARAYHEGKDAAGLVAVLAQWLEREPNNAEVLARSLGSALEHRDAEGALSLYDRLARLGVTPPSEQASALCQLCLARGHAERAIELLRVLAEREPKPAKRAALLLDAAELMFQAGDAPAARTAAQEARSLDATSADAVLLLAKLSLAAGARDEAQSLLHAHAESKERRRGKPLARVLRLAADLHLEQDELGEALPLLVEAHQLDKTDLDSALLLGLLAIDLDRLETAASALRVLIAQRELGTREGAAARSLSLAQGYFQLARIEQHHGKKTNAKRMALRALEEDPKLHAAQTLLNELGLH